MIKNKQLRRLMEADSDHTYEEGEPPREVSVEDLDNSEYNPANDAYIGMIKQLRHVMTLQSRKLKPSYLTITKLAEQGQRASHIAQQVRLHPQTVLRALKHPDVMALRETMQQYSGLLAGSTQAQRDNMLYRIAVRSEIADPKVAISALAEMSKTEHNARLHQLAKKQGGTSNQTVIVQLNDSRLTASKLDESPAHLIKDVN